MKHIIILGDGMADHPIVSLGGGASCSPNQEGRTCLQAAHTPNMDRLAQMGRCGLLKTVPPGLPPGSEVANASILGYDMTEVYEGRGPLEAASIGYEMEPGDLALRCNILTLAEGKIINHHGGNLHTEEGRVLIDALNEALSPIYPNGKVKFIAGTQYRHLLIIKGGDKRVDLAPPHDHPGESWQALMPKAQVPEAEPTAQLLRDLIIQSQEVLSRHPFNQGRTLKANSIWMWSGGYRPSMATLSQQFPEVKSGSVISAVDLIKGIGYYAGLKILEVEGATGQWDTNYEGKAQAAIDALRQGDDFVFVHVEASDEAGHDGEVDLKVRTIENLDKRLLGPIMEYVQSSADDISIAVLPDHPTPAELRIHVDEPVPFAIWHKGIVPDTVGEYNEEACAKGSFGLLKYREFIENFMKA